MAEPYKGLYIEIGADSTALRRDLEAINKACNATAKQLRDVEKALRFEGASTGNLENKLDLLREKGEELNTKFVTIAQSMKKLESLGADKLAANIRNINLHAEEARRSYDRVDVALEKVNDQFAQLALQKGNLVGISEVTRKNRAELVTYGRAIAEEFSKADASIKKLVDKHRELSKTHGALQAELGKAKLAKEWNDARIDLQGVSSEMAHVRAEMKDIGSELGTSEMGAALVDIQQKLQKDETAARALREEFERVDKALSTAPGNKGLTDLKIKNIQEQSQMARERVDELNRSIARLREQKVDDTGLSMKQLTDNVAASERRFDMLTRAVEGASAKVGLLRTKLHEIKTKDPLNADGIKEVEGELARANRQLEVFDEKAKEARNALDMDRGCMELRNLRTEAERTTGEIERLEAEEFKSRHYGIGQKFSRMRSLGVSLQSTVTPAIMMAGYGIVNAADQVDAAYRDMKKTVDGEIEDFERLRKAAMDYASTHVTSADTILEIEAMGGQLGIAVENLEEFAHVASNLDIATDMDADEISQSLGQLNNVLHWSEGDMQRFADAMVELGNNMPAQESQIMAITKRIGAAASMYGMSTPEILAWSTAIAATGQNEEAAGTAISNTLSDIENAVATGGEELALFAETAGLSAEEFASKWETAPSEAFKAFVEGLARIEQSGGSAEVVLTQLGITGVRQKQALKGLSQTTNIVAKSQKLANAAWYQGGQAEREAAQKSEGFSGALKQLKNSAQNAGSTVGDNLTPFVKGLSEVVNTATDVFKKLPVPIQTAATGILAFTGVLGPVLNITGAIGNSLDDAAEKMIKSGGASKKLGEGLTSLLEKFNSLKLVVGALAIGAVIAGIIGIKSAMDEAAAREDALARSTESLGDRLSRLSGAAAEDGFGGMASSAESAMERIKALNDASDNAVAEFADSMDSAFAGLAGAIADKSRIEQYVDIIERLTNKTDQYGNKVKLTASEQMELQAAVDALNEVCGTNIEVIDSQNGVIDTSIGKVKALADEWIKLALAQQYHESIVSAGIKKNELEKTLLEQKAALDEGREAYEQAIETIDTFQKKQPTALQDTGRGTPQAITDAQQIIWEYEELEGKFEDTQAQIDAIDASIRQAERDYAALSGVQFATVDEVADKFSSLSEQLNVGVPSGFLKDLAKVVADAGIDVKELDTMTVDVLEDLVNAYDGSFASIEGILEGYRETAKNALEDPVVTAGAIKEAIHGVIDEYTSVYGVTHEPLPDSIWDQVAETVAEAGASVDDVFNNINYYELYDLAKALIDSHYSIDVAKEKLVEYGVELGKVADDAEEAADDIEQAGITIGDAMNSIDLDEYAGSGASELAKSLDGVKLSAEDAATAIDGILSNKDTSLSDATAAINDTIHKMGLGVRDFTEYEVYMTLALGGGTDALIQAAIAMSEYEGATEDATEETEEFKGILDGFAGSIDDVGKFIADYDDEAAKSARLSKALGDVIGNVGSYHTVEEAVSDVNAVLKQYGVITDDLTDAQALAILGFDGTTEAAIEMARGFQAANDEEKALAEAAEKAAEAVQKQYDTMRELAKTDVGVREMLKSVGTNADELTGSLLALGISVDDFKSRYDALSNVSNPLEAISQQTGVYTWQLRDNLQSNIDLVSGWKDNIVKLYGMATNETEAEFVKYVESLGPEYAQFVQYLADVDEYGNTATVPLAELAQKWADAGGLASTSALEFAAAYIDALERAGVEITDAEKQSILDAASDTGEAVPEGVADGIEQNSFQVTDAASVLGDTAVDGLIAINDELRARGEAAGGFYMLGMREGFAGGGEGAEGAEGSVADSLLAGFSEDMEAKGSEGGSAFLTGIESVADGAGASAYTVTSKALEAMAAFVDLAGTQGTNAGSMFSESLAATETSALDAGATIRQSAMNGLMHGIAATHTATSVGSDMGYNYADGIASTDSYAGAKAGIVSDAAADALNAHAIEAYWYGHEMGSNFAAGISAAVPLISAAATEAAGAAAAPIHFTEPKVGPLVGINESGAEMVRNYAASMREGVGEIRDAAKLAADAARFDGWKSEAGALTRGASQSWSNSQVSTRVTNVYVNGRYTDDAEVSRITGEYIRQMAEMGAM